MKKLLLTFLIAFITALGLNATVKTATFDNNDCSGDIASEISIANGDIKISVTKNSNGNGVKYFASKPAAFRMYGGASMKFTCTNSGEKITKIEFTMSTSNGLGKITLLQLLQVLTHLQTHGKALKGLKLSLSRTEEHLETHVSPK